MITNEHTSKYKPDDVNPTIGFFYDMAQLMNTPRQGWLDHGVSEQDCESVADHSYKVATLGFMIAERHRQDLDSFRVMRLALFHDIGEIYSGDITPRDGVSAEEKSRRELEGVEKILSGIQNSEIIMESWQEYENQVTPEAIFVKDIDRLEMALQARLYEQRGYENLGAFFKYVYDRLELPEVRNLYDQMMAGR
ncbi:HD domain-containing protein [Candidatus Woesearchaeota archaeon]|nr:HD domain-containing protein [Candidatus Woesearchaeota archaeon]